VQAHPGAMTKSTRRTEGEELEITRAFFGRTSTHLGTNVRGGAFYGGIHVDFLRARTRHPATMDDSQYWHARSVAAVRARCSDVISPVCKKISACYKFVKSKPHTGMTELVLQHMDIAEMNGNREPEFQADVPGSWGECSYLSSWFILRHHPRLRDVDPPGAGRAQARPFVAGAGGVPVAAGVAARDALGAPDAAGDDRPLAPGHDGSGGEELSLPAGTPGAPEMGSKRSKDVAAMLASSASVAKRINTLTKASTSKLQIFKNMERNQFFNSSSMSERPGGASFSGSDGGPHDF